MASWATIAKASPNHGLVQQGESLRPGEYNIVVVDANAIISGMQVDRLAAKVVTIEDVLQEIRDRKSRQFLSSLPFGITVQEPTEESIKTVVRFSRETGDIHSLSQTDVKLLALSHTIEVQAHGGEHLRQHPLQAVAKSKTRQSGQMQGWDFVPNPDEWKDLDEQGDDAAGGQTSKSRVINVTQPLQSAQQQTPVEADEEPFSPGSPSNAEPTSSTEAIVDVSSRSALHADQVASLMEEDEARRKKWEEERAQGASAGDTGLGEDGDDGAAWQTAACSKNASRRRKRRAIRRAARAETAGVTNLLGPMSGMQLQNPEVSTPGKEEMRAQVVESRGADSGSTGKQQTMQVDEDDDEDDTASSRPNLAVAPASPGQDEVQSRAPPATPTLPSKEATIPLSQSPAPPLPAAPSTDKNETSAMEELPDVAPEAQAEEVVIAGDKAVGEKAEGAEREQGVVMQEQNANEPREQAAGETQPELEEEDVEQQEEDEDEDEDESETELVMLEGDTGGVDLLQDEDEDEEEEEVAAQTKGADQQPSNGFQSTVATITADFAMQNVLLQMGLKLLTTDGRQIKHLRRWVLRCSACFFVTKEVGRIFCPRCGNMAMERAEVMTGPDGTQLYGVRRRPIIRGTKYSLPKPKGGRHAANPILREDELMLKMRRKKKKNKDVDSAALLEELGPDTWFKINQGSAAAKGINLHIPSAKNNPNERKGVRTNRRK